MRLAQWRLCHELERQFATALSRLTQRILIWVNYHRHALLYDGALWAVVSLGQQRISQMYRITFDCDCDTGVANGPWVVCMGAVLCRMKT